jgi:hypothetical protein
VCKGGGRVRQGFVGRGKSQLSFCQYDSTASVTTHGLTQHVLLVPCCCAAPPSPLPTPWRPRPLLPALLVHAGAAASASRMVARSFSTTPRCASSAGGAMGCAAPTARASPL